VLDLIERKAAGEEIAVQPQAEEPEAAPDLMAALEASLAEMGKDGEKPAAKKPAAKKPAAKKAAPKSGRTRRRTPVAKS
jgi:non-homologous end joining protein Ku